MCHWEWWEWNHSPKKRQIEIMTSRYIAWWKFNAGGNGTIAQIDNTWENSSSRYIWAPSPCMLQPTSLSNVQLACAACMQGWFDQGFCFETCSQKADLVSESVFPRIKVLKANSLECAKACITSWGNSTFTGTERGALRLPSTWGHGGMMFGISHVEVEELNMFIPMRNWNVYPISNMEDML